MEGALLDRLGPWTLGAAVVGALLLAAEIGYRLGLGARGRGDDHAALPTSAVEGGLLGLLALLLAFSLSAAIQLHQEREALLVKESSAIGRAALGAGLLPEPGNRVNVNVVSTSSTGSTGVVEIVDVGVEPLGDAGDALGVRRSRA